MQSEQGLENSSSRLVVYSVPSSNKLIINLSSWDLRHVPNEISQCLCCDLYLSHNATLNWRLVSVYHHRLLLGLLFMFSLLLSICLFGTCDCLLPLSLNLGSPLYLFS
jgi:hypothetical protein